MHIEQIICSRQAKTRGHKMWQMPRTNHNVGKHFDQLFLLFFNSSAESESTNIINTSPKQISQINSQCSPNQKVNGGQSCPKSTSNQFGQQQNSTASREGQRQPKIARSTQTILAVISVVKQKVNVVKLSPIALICMPKTVA